MKRDEAELEANLRKVATQAVMEIDGALDDDASNFEQTSHINQQLKLARASYEDARERYLNGLSDFLSVSTSLRSTQQVELQSLSQRESQILSRIKVYRVLGGFSLSRVLNLYRHQILNNGFYNV